MSPLIPIASPGSRAFLLPTQNGFVLVDTGMDPQARAIRRTLTDQGASVKDLRLIVVTHGHLDHYSAASALRTESGAPVAAHPREASFVKIGGSSPTVARRWVGRLLNRVTRRMKNAPCPVDLEVESLDLSTYGVEGWLMATPGHTAGSLSVVLASGDALVGDLLRGRSGALELGFFCEDPQATCRSLMSLEAAGVQTLHLAHGTQVGRNEWARWAHEAVHQ